jgi:hypothetical protein
MEFYIKASKNDINFKTYGPYVRKEYAIKDAKIFEKRLNFLTIKVIQYGELIYQYKKSVN